MEGEDVCACQTLSLWSNGCRKSTYDCFGKLAHEVQSSSITVADVPDVGHKQVRLSQVCYLTW